MPNGATTGPVVVTVGGIDSNGMSFTVTASGTLPAPWLSQDVGNPAIAGQASHASGTFSVTGAGMDIWDSTDQFRFVYQTLNGDGEIVARVASLQNTDGWAKAGVMMREDLTANAPNAFVMVTAANGMSFQRRGTRGGATTATSAAFGTTAPQWVRLVRAGTTLSGYYSRERHRLDADRHGHHHAADSGLCRPGRDQSQPSRDLHGHLQQCHRCRRRIGRPS